jgi:hypothetical protein
VSKGAGTSALASSHGDAAFVSVISALSLSQRTHYKWYAFEQAPYRRRIWAITKGDFAYARGYNRPWAGKETWRTFKSHEPGAQAGPPASHSLDSRTRDQWPVRMRQYSWTSGLGEPLRNLQLATQHDRWARGPLIRGGGEKLMNGQYNTALAESNITF